VFAELQGVVAIYGAFSAFAALRRDGTVVTWGRDGGLFLCVSLMRVFLSWCMYVWLLEMAWCMYVDVCVGLGNVRAKGGDSSAVQTELQGVVAISATSKAFAARRADGRVVIWGNKCKLFSPSLSLLFSLFSFSPFPFSSFDTTKNHSHSLWWK